MPSPASCAESCAAPLVIEELILRGRSGERQALKMLIERYQARIAKFVLAETGDANASEDVCQAIFVKMVMGLSGLRDAERFESWLFQIARNACRDHLRARQGWRRYFVAYSRVHEHIPAPQAYAAPETEERVSDCLARLPPGDRAMLQLRLDEKRSYEEIARLSNTTVSAIKSRFYRMRRELRGLLVAGDSE